MVWSHDGVLEAGQRDVIRSNLEGIILPKFRGKHDIYLEIGERRVFTGAVEWPGWCRSGRDEESAIQALLESGPRYSLILQSTNLGFKPPENASSLKVVERLNGNSTTDFGAPDMPISRDKESIEADELHRLQILLNACWGAFDKAVSMADGHPLRKGPRGGGRDLMGIVDHVINADESYLKRIGWKIAKIEEVRMEERLKRIRKEILDAFESAVQGDLPVVGPRGGKRWVPHFFVRRVSWHIMDHAWEIEDRVLEN